MRALKEEANPIFETLKLHGLWLASKGAKGARAVFIRGEITEVDFEPFDISYAIFRNCIIKNCMFKAKALKGTSFTGSTFHDTSFSTKVFEEIDFEKVVFLQSRFNEAVFFLCNFKSIRLEKTDIIKCKFIKSGIKNSVFTYSAFNHSSFKECALELAAFKGCDLGYTRFKLSTLTEINFSGTDLHSAKFEASTLMKIHFKSWKRGEGKKMPTSLGLVKFIDCQMSACSFEENKKNITSKIINTENFTKMEKGKSSIENRASYLYKTINILFVLCAASLPCSFAFLRPSSPVKLLSYCLALFIITVALSASGKIYVEYLKKYHLSRGFPFILERIINFNKTWKNFLCMFIFFILPCLFLMKGWAISITGQNLKLSLAHLAMFFYPLALNFIILNSFYKKSSAETEK